MKAREGGLCDKVRSWVFRMWSKCEFTTILGVRWEAIVSMYQFVTCTSHCWLVHLIHWLVHLIHWLVHLIHWLVHLIADLYIWFTDLYISFADLYILFTDLYISFADLYILFTDFYISFTDFSGQKIPRRTFYVFRSSYRLQSVGFILRGYNTMSIVAPTTPLVLPRNAQGVIVPFSSSSWRSTGIIGTNAGTPSATWSTRWIAGADSLMVFIIHLNPFLLVLECQDQLQTTS